MNTDLVTNIIHERLFTVCFDIQLNIAGETQNKNSTLLKNNATVRWKFGSCTSLNSIENSGHTLKNLNI